MRGAIAIRAPMGLGKTKLTVDEIVRTKGSVEYYAPTHALAEEVRDAIRQQDPRLEVIVMCGRSHPGPDGKPLCRKHKLAEELARAGGEVFSSMCEKTHMISKEPAFHRCEYFYSCPYIAQFGQAKVTIYPHAYLPLRRMKLEQDVPDVAVIDESFYNSCIEVIEVPLNLLRAPFLDEPTAHVLTLIEQALLKGEPVFEDLRKANVDFQQIAIAKKATGRRAEVIYPSMPAAYQRRALRSIRERRLLQRLLSVLCQEYMARPTRTASQGLLYIPESQTIKVHVNKAISRFHERTYGAPGKESRVILIDGSADDQIIKQWFPDVTMSTISAPRNARVVQVSSTRCSTTSLTPRRNTDPESRKAARGRLRQLDALITRVAAQHGKVLVVGPQAITGNPRAKVKPLIRVPPNVDLAHFNAIRGIDRWKNHEAIVLIGRNEPPIPAVEEIARCVYQRSPYPLTFSDDWVMQSRGYRLKGGKQGVAVVTHPDPRIQAILEQMREAESVQAIDRLRLIHATSTKAVYILSNIPLDIDVDELVTWDELMEGSRLEQAWSALPGVLPLAPDWLAARFPHLWKSPDAAKADVRRAIKECQITNFISISNLTLFKHQYRPTRPLSGGSRQRAWSVFLGCNPTPEGSRTGLQGVLGFPVEFRQESRNHAAGEPADVASASSSSSDICASAAILPRASDESSTLRTSGA